jgi:hypothetical protein
MAAYFVSIDTASWPMTTTVTRPGQCQRCPGIKVGL